MLKIRRCVRSRPAPRSTELSHWSCSDSSRKPNAAFSDLFSEPDLWLVENVNSARPREDGYNPTDRAAAILALAQPTHNQPGDDQIRGAAWNILRRK